MKSEMNIEEFIELYKKERPMYEKWGEYVSEYILDKLNSEFVNLDIILKIPVKSRTKSVESLVEKAFYRNKKYENPYYDITDKVGVRFVVMVEQHIEIIKHIVENNNIWSYSKDFDYNVLKNDKPDVFTYQSVHYIVKNREQIEINGYKIYKDTPCEIQIRTLEQHAYAEISHTFIYKKESNCSKLNRMLSRTAAFNEESDELYGEMYNMVNSIEDKYNDFMKGLKDKYNFSFESDKLNRVIYDDIYLMLEKYHVTLDDLTKFIDDNKYILSLIEMKKSDILFNQPVIIMIYYLVYNYNHEFSEIWQLPDDMLDSVKVDLGISDN